MLLGRRSATVATATGIKSDCCWTSATGFLLAICRSRSGPGAAAAVLLMLPVLFVPQVALHHQFRLEHSMAHRAHLPSRCLVALRALRAGTLTRLRLLARPRFSLLLFLRALPRPLPRPLFHLDPLSLFHLDPLLLDPLPLLSLLPLSPLLFPLRLSRSPRPLSRSRFTQNLLYLHAFPRPRPLRRSLFALRPRSCLCHNLDLDLEVASRRQCDERRAAGGRRQVE
mmetsp:Transcript_18237/g.48158  ORF Transcript_18237/g.48158 Transcript_18237/m.48158 type:complete len:226 (-) Transcript_18237:361-1038(-)